MRARPEAKRGRWRHYPDWVAENLLEAVNKILEEMARGKKPPRAPAAHRA